MIAQQLASPAVECHCINHNLPRDFGTSCSLTRALRPWKAMLETQGSRFQCCVVTVLRCVAQLMLLTIITGSVSHERGEERWTEEPSSVNLKVNVCSVTGYPTCSYFVEYYRIFCVAFVA
jgi:hypothetical protein